MANEVEQELRNRVVDWIEDEAKIQDISVATYPTGIAQNGNYLRVPVAILQDGDAYDRATWLQQIEDAWDPAAFNGMRLTIVSAKRPEPPKPELYSRVEELMMRQDLLLDRVGDGANDPETLNGFQTIRQEWYRALDDMAQLFPSIKNGAG